MNLVRARGEMSCSWGEGIKETREDATAGKKDDSK